MSFIYHQVDAAYFQSSRKRLAASIKPQQKRKIALIEDDSEVTKLAGGTNEAPLYVKNRQVCVFVWRLCGACAGVSCCCAHRQDRAALTLTNNPTLSQCLCCDVLCFIISYNLHPLPLLPPQPQLKHKAAVAGTANKKREKLSKDELEEQLFNLFAQQQHWHFTQLQVRLVG